jgi:hypothetical protein
MSAERSRLAWCVVISRGIDRIPNAIKSHFKTAKASNTSKLSNLAARFLCEAILHANLHVNLQAELHAIFPSGISSATSASALYNLSSIAHIGSLLLFRPLNSDFTQFVGRNPGAPGRVPAQSSRHAGIPARRDLFAAYNSCSAFFWALSTILLPNYLKRVAITPNTNKPIIK